LRHGFKGRHGGGRFWGREHDCRAEGHHGREHGFHGRGPGGHRMRRGGRMFEQGDLRFLMLKLIEEKPRHGYDLIKAIEERLGGMYAPSPGVVYPTLTLLEDMGQIAPQPGEGSKKLFALTDDGRDYLAANSEAVEAAFARMKAAEAAFGAGPSPRIIRAMENLKLALRLKMGAGGLSDAQADCIADAIDAAAKAVEKA
jgi:DNA-binding PadR family transcriptional regulator